MGCAPSKTKKPGKTEEDAALKNIPSHIRIPLDKEEIATLQQSWSSVSHNMIRIGMKMFYKLFQKEPEVRDLFKQFKHMNMADLEGSQDLENHAILVMNAIDESLSHFHQEAQLIEMLIGTGKFHIDLEDFKPHLFYLIEEPYMDNMLTSLGEYCTPKLESIHQRAIHFILDTLVEGYRMAEQEAKEAKEGFTEALDDTAV